MTRRQTHQLIRIFAAALLTAVALLLQEGLFATLPSSPLGGELLRLALFLLPYLIVGGSVLLGACRNLLGGRLLDERFLMAVATVGAFLLGEYVEAVAVMLFYQVGELFESIAVRRSRRSIAALMDIRPDTACVLREGRELQVPPEEVAVGESIRILPGERIPLDGVVLSGASSMDTAALTGESLPRAVGVGSQVVSGAVNLQGVLTVRVESIFAESTVARILDLVENASEKKARVEGFITRFALWYTPLVVAAALCLALVPPLFDAFAFRKWVGRALIFLVVSCPCALVISVPLSFFGGIGGAARRGILIKGASYLEQLSRLDVVAFDKTGTLTHGRFRVTEVQASKGGEEALLALAAAIEASSSHPLARAVCAAAEGLPLPSATEITEHLGRGMQARVDGQRVLIGNLQFMQENGVCATPCVASSTALYLAAEGEYLGCLLLSDEPKPDARQSIAALKKMGIDRIVMMSGDRREVGEATASLLGIDEARCELLPADKVSALEELLAPGRTVAFVGDGINDAPVLSRADVGIAMGALGSDAAIEAADVVLMDDRPTALPEAVALSRKTMRIVRQNICLALGVKAAALLLGAFGIADMWLAIFADVGVTMLAVLNAMRTLAKRG